MGVGCYSGHVRPLTEHLSIPAALVTDENLFDRLGERRGTRIAPSGLSAPNRKFKKDQAEMTPDLKPCQVSKYFW